MHNILMYALLIDMYMHVVAIYLRPVVFFNFIFNFTFILWFTQFFRQRDRSALHAIDGGYVCVCVSGPLHVVTTAGKL